MTETAINPEISNLSLERAGVPVPEFIALVAGLMALNALAIDVMLPALGQIGEALGAATDNDAQLVVLVYVLGFGMPQLVFGPLSDRFGRKPILYVSLVGYTIAGIGCMFSQTFEQLLVWRFLQGLAASGGRVVAASMVRDIYAGRGMARIMSLVMTVFMVVPILAPGIGALVLLVAPWEATFGVLVAGSVGMFVWTALRLKETLPPANRGKLSGRFLLQAYREILTTRVTIGYMLASGVIFGALFSFIASSPQVFGDVFHVGASFPLWFGGIALSMSAMTFLNSRLVEKVGMRWMSHTALFGFIGFATLALAGMMFVGEEIWLFYPLFAITFGFFGLLGANFNALAMEPLGRIAGIGSAVHGFLTTTLAGFIGGQIAGRFDGTTIPILEGFVALGLLTLAIVLVTEKGRLFSSR